MFFLLGAIVGLIAAGCLVAHVVILTVKWIKNKIREKLAKKKIVINYLKIIKILMY